MNRKRLLTAGFISVVLMSVIIGTKIVNLTQAISDSIVIESPRNNTVYKNSIPLNYSIISSSNYPNYYKQKWVSWIGYSIDNETVVTITPPVTITEQSIPILPLSELPNGEHKISVIVQFAYTTSIGAYAYNVSSAPVHFLVDVNESIRKDNSPPNIFIQSPENKTYNMTEMLLNFTVDELVILMGYRLNAQDYVIISDNTTLTGLSYGSHNITLYATDAAGNTGISETITFTITQEKETEPSSEALVAAAAVSVAVVCVGLLVYFRKHKRTKL